MGVLFFLHMDVTKLFQQFTQKRVLVIGDVMLDSYLWGKVHRISPEAPVPIVNVHKREMRLGGAANVALNVLALGATPILCAVVGQDTDSENLDRLLRTHALSNEGILKSASRMTTIKHRIMAGSQQLLRVDSEMDTPISDEDSQRLLQKIEALLPQVQVIIFEDYDKGVLTLPLIEAVIHRANAQGIPTVVDPKKRNFLAYRGCTLFKPNLKELREGIQQEIPSGNLDALQAGIRALRAQMPHEATMVTLSEHGVYICNQDEVHHQPAHTREIADVSGAGDTVVSIAALCVACGTTLQHTAALANLGGGLVCESLGVVPIEKEKLLKEAKSGHFF